MKMIYSAPRDEVSHAGGRKKIGPRQQARRARCIDASRWHAALASLHVFADPETFEFPSEPRNLCR